MKPFNQANDTNKVLTLQLHFLGNQTETKKIRDLFYLCQSCRRRRLQGQYAVVVVVFKVSAT